MMILAPLQYLIEKIVIIKYNIIQGSLLVKKESAIYRTPQIQPSKYPEELQITLLITKILMSEVDKQDFKREYLPLVNQDNEGNDLTPTPNILKSSENQAVNHNKSIVSEMSGNNKYSVVKTNNENADPQEGFFKKNKKVLIIAGIVLLVVGAIVGIVLGIVLGGKDNPHIDPDKPQPDPYQYQEFNPFYVDPNSPPEVTTFQGNFYLKFNSTAFPPIIPPNNTNVTQQTHLPRQLHQLPKSLQNFLSADEIAHGKQAGNATLNGTNYRPMNPQYVANTTNNTWAQNVWINVQMNSNNQAKVTALNSDANANETARRLVNNKLFPRPALEIEARLQQAGFKYNQTASFAFNFTDIYSGETLVTTMYRKMVITDFYSEIGFVLPTQRCFGLGQRNGKFQLDQGTYSFNARAHDAPLDQDDGLGGKSGNHIHPFVLCQTEQRKDFFGMFFASTGPQVFEVVKFYNSTKMVLNYITVGGALEFYVLIRGSAQDIISRYQGLVGMPMMPPYYALGVWHGSNIYASWTKVKSIYDNYAGAVNQRKLALEGVFVENYNQGPHWTFTVDPTAFPNLGTEVDGIHGNNQRIIFGASFALNPDPSYPLYAQAKQGQCLVRSHPTLSVGPLNGILNQTLVQYLDTFNGCFDSWLATAIKPFEQTAAHGLDGLIVQDAHLPNHVNGQIVLPGKKAAKPRRMLLKDEPPVQAINEEMVGFYSSYQVNNQSNTQNTDLSTYYLPFIPAFKYSGALDNMTVSLNSTLGDDLGGGRYSSLLVRNGISGYALKRTFQGVSQYKKNSSRTLLFSDATWAGSGAYSAALVTDLYRSWDQMRQVIGQTLALSMFGHAATMVDTCGSLGPMDEALCTRWTQLATYMPLVRNYFNATYREPGTGNRLATTPSEPWMTDNDQFSLAYAAMGDRLRLSRYLYTQMYLAHTQGGALVQPLFYLYPRDDRCFEADVINSTYMLGPAVKVTPTLENKADGADFQAYFPQGKWVNLYQPQSVIDGNATAKIIVDSSQPNIHQKSGTIIPWLNNNKALRTTRDVEQQLRTGFRIVRDPSTLAAEGDLMIDDGITPNLYSPAYMDTYQHTVFDKNFTHYVIRMSSAKTINFMVQNGDSAYVPPANTQYGFLDQIDIMNAQDLMDMDFACALNSSWIPTNLTIYYTNSTQTLTIKPKVGNDFTFDQLNLIKFGKTGADVDYCQGFSYKATFDTDGKADTFVRYNLTSYQPSHIVEDLIAEFTLLDDEGTIHVEITTKSDYESGKKKLYRPPQPEFWSLDAFQDIPHAKLSDFLQIETNNFTYQILNKQGQEVYHSDPLRLFVTPNFVMEGGYFKPNPATGRPLMGIGERAGRAMFKDEHDSVHTIWPYDAPNPIDDGKGPGKNMYGYQPVYYYQADTSDWIAVFHVSTYASDYFVNTNFDGIGTARVSKIATGGLVHKIYIQQPNVEAAIHKYQLITGYQTVPPMWAFGWNQCKFGYFNEDIWWGVYQNYTRFNIPLDTMWADIDYMDDYKVFTISNQTYSHLPDRVAQIKMDGRYFVPIIDNAIAVRPNKSYAPFDSGLAQDVFIKRADGKAPATGGVWPGWAYYPDFFKPETVKWWQDNLGDFNKKIQFDGIWLDMNEPSSTCQGSCNPDELPAQPLKHTLPYWPGQRDLEVQALVLEAQHTGLPKGDGTYWTEMDVRSLYAIKESQATKSFLGKNAKRPFILSRSNAPGLQKYAFHWLADNWSSQEWLQTSVDSLYTFNLFGIPMMGSDICGFNLDATPELCTRWHQLGAFYPFSRNHKNSVWKQTEPFQYNFTVPDLDNGLTYTDLIRTALLQRYSLIRYIYSIFHHIGEQGGAFFKPLYYEFQDDATTFNADATERNILIGPALKLSIQTQDPLQVSTEYQFPAARWCQVFPTFDQTKCFDTTEQGGMSTVQRLDSGIADYQVHLRGGRIIPYQNATALNVTKSGDLMQQPTELWVLINLKQSDITIAPQTYNALAAGTVYLDDGFSATDIGRWDFFVNSSDNKVFNIEFTKVNELIDKQGAGKAAQVSAITFLWASNSGLKDIKQAEIKETTGASITLDPPQYDNVTDTLRVAVKDGQQGKVWSFWDIKTIVIQ